jgi:hypothetical protein
MKPAGKCGRGAHNFVSRAGDFKAAIRVRDVRKVHGITRLALGKWSAKIF